ncbi:hypothetical protein WN48_01452 [Eufriesea mexicana]|nr:hypothetical protein WN48_01452 [Eufriesea mexicana]
MNVPYAASNTDEPFTTIGVSYKVPRSEDRLLAALSTHHAQASSEKSKRAIASNGGYVYEPPNEIFTPSPRSHRTPPRPTIVTSPPGTPGYNYPTPDKPFTLPTPQTQPPGYTYPSEPTRPPYVPPTSPDTSITPHYTVPSTRPPPYLPPSTTPPPRVTVTPPPPPTPIYTLVPTSTIYTPPPTGDPAPPPTLPPTTKRPIGYFYAVPENPLELPPFVR